MKKTAINSFIFFLVILWKYGFTQINCIPKVGDIFYPISETTILRTESNPNSQVAIVTPLEDEVSPDNIQFICIKDGVTNGFVSIKLSFMYSSFEDFGLNSNMCILFDELNKRNSNPLPFKEFYRITQDTSEIKRMYFELLGEDWFTNWSTYESYDMSSFTGFYNYWINSEKEKWELEYFLENHESEFFVHSSLIKTNPVLYTITGPNIGVDYYRKELENQVQLRKERSCEYNPENIFNNLELLVGLLIKEDESFEAIKAINQYESYIVSEKGKLKISYLRMRASYYDDNIKGALVLGEKLIYAYKNMQITNNKEERYGDIDMAFVYAITISCLIKEGKYEKGLQISDDCLKKEFLQQENFFLMRAELLAQLDRREEACELLNAEYMKGNERARELYFKKCK